MALNSITTDHVLGITEYYARYNSKTPEDPSADTLMSEIYSIASTLGGVDDLGDVPSVVKDLNSLSPPDFSDFIDYHQRVYEKMEDFRSSVCNALEVTGSVHEDPDLSALTREELEDVVLKMREELSLNLPYAATVKSHIVGHKVCPLFAEMFSAFGVSFHTMFPDIKRGNYFVDAPEIGLRMVWTGRSLHIHRNRCILNVTEDKIGMQGQGDSGYLTIDVYKIKKIFVDWTKPTKEEGDLFQMLYPTHQYNLDKIFGDI